MLTVSQVKAAQWKNRHEGYGASFYRATCDIVQRIQTADSGGLIVVTLPTVQTAVPCYMVEIKQKTIDGNQSATTERNFTLYLRDCVIIKDDYMFTNFQGLQLVDPGALYKQVMETERNQTGSQGGLYMYSIKGLKRIDKKA
jgi:hypothetical protein